MQKRRGATLTLGAVRCDVQMSTFHTDARCKSIAEYRRIEDRCFGTVEGRWSEPLPDTSR